MTSANQSDRTAMVAAGVVFVAGVALWLLGFGDPDPRRPWLALLSVFMFVTPLAGGLVVCPAMIQLGNGRWPGPADRWLLGGAWFAPVSVVALAVLAIGSARWAPWAQGPEPQGLWLAPAFVFSRDFVALILFWAVSFFYLARRNTGGGKTAAAALAVVYGFAFTLLGIDLVMALDPHWASSLFGGYVFISGLYAAVAAWALIAALDPTTPPAKLHDLGKLVFAFCMLTTYMMYCHLLPIWYENLPHETRFLVPRVNYPPWNIVSIGLLVSVYLGPIAFLLPVRAKRTRAILAPICVLILLGLFVERFWLTLPVFSPHRIVFGLPEIGIGAALLAGLYLSVAIFRPRAETAAEDRP